MGGLTNPRPWRGRCRAGYSNTGGPPLPRQREPLRAKRYCQTFFGKPVLSISDFSLIDKPFFSKKHPFGFVNKRKITY